MERLIWIGVGSQRSFQIIRLRFCDSCNSWSNVDYKSTGRLETGRMGTNRQSSNHGQHRTDRRSNGSDWSILDFIFDLHGGGEGRAFWFWGNRAFWYFKADGKRSKSK